MLDDFADGLLVHREAVRLAEAEKDVEGHGKPSSTDWTTTTSTTESGERGKAPAPTENLPKRFFASIPIESERAGIDVARIMDGLLVELTRTRGSTLRLTLEIEGGSSEQGYSKDVVDTVKANARDLKLDEASFGFEED